MSHAVFLNRRRICTIYIWRFEMLALNGGLYLTDLHADFVTFSLDGLLYCGLSIDARNAEYNPKVKIFPLQR